MHVIKAYVDNPFDQIFRHPGFYNCPSRRLWPYLQFFLHTVPAYLVDFGCIVIGKKPRSHTCT